MIGIRQLAAASVVALLVLLVDTAIQSIPSKIKSIVSSVSIGMKYPILGTAELTDMLNN